ncbi:MAG: sulfotransferase domain-containing protein [Acidobacteriota bacterium]|nr:MAG: sulfotransferase domain-containing protein [Acidobacteriota bacterium]
MGSRVQQMMRKFRYGEPIVVVSGLPRSGTSMAMRMLEAGGMQLAIDGIRQADEDNPRGYFEHERVKDLDKEGDKDWLKQERGRAIKIISFLLPHLPATNNYRVIFMQRDLREVLASQSKMLVNRGEDSGAEDEQMSSEYEQHLERVAFLLRYRPQFEVLEVKHREVIESPLEQARRMAAFVGHGLDADKMAAAVEQQLYRNRAS